MQKPPPEEIGWPMAIAVQGMFGAAAIVALSAALEGQKSLAVFALMVLVAYFLGATVGLAVLGGLMRAAGTTMLWLLKWRLEYRADLAADLLGPEGEAAYRTKRALARRSWLHDLASALAEVRLAGTAR